MEDAAKTQENAVGNLRTEGVQKLNQSHSSTAEMLKSVPKTKDKCPWASLSLD